MPSYSSYKQVILWPLAMFLMNCHPGESPSEKSFPVANTSQNEFDQYWFQGEAEINSYQVEQSRYGEMRQGEAVLVFVTEDFSKEKQVKLDDPERDWKDKVPVLKLNNIRRFVTGVYDYSMMQSVFTPIKTKEFSHSLKTTTSVQDWCGHVFTQFNLDGDHYRIAQFSYFEQEGDKESKIPARMLEDEIWTRLRISPESIKEGEIEVIPAVFYSRLQHKELRHKKARLRFENREAMRFLVLEYLHLDRTLSIGFEPVFPFKILTWKEQDGGKITSQGFLKSSIKSPYWKQNGNEFEYLRDSLQLL